MWQSCQRSWKTISVATLIARASFPKRWVRSSSGTGLDYAVSLVTLLQDGAVRAPDQPLVLTPDRSVSYAECLARSEALARGLRARAIERFACIVADPAVVLALLCASTAVSSEACLYPADIDEALI